MPESVLRVAIATPPLPSNIKHEPTIVACNHERAQKSLRRSNPRHHAKPSKIKPATRKRADAQTNAPCCETSLMTR